MGECQVGLEGTSLLHRQIPRRAVVGPGVQVAARRRDRRMAAALTMRMYLGRIEMPARGAARDPPGRGAGIGACPI